MANFDGDRSANRSQADLTFRLESGKQMANKYFFATVEISVNTL
jgi:hypothetical protein